MAGADAERCRGGRRAAAGLLLALVAASGCSVLASHDESGGDAPRAPAAELAAPAPAVPTVSLAAQPAQTATRIARVTIDSAPPTTRVVLQLDGTAEPEVSLLANQRLVIDVPQVTCAGLPRIVEAPGDPLVERVRTGQHGPPEDRSRIVIDLRTRADFSVRVQGDRIIAYLAPADAASAPSSPAAGAPSRILFGAEGAAGVSPSGPESSPSSTPASGPGDDASVPAPPLPETEPDAPPTPAPQLPAGGAAPAIEPTPEAMVIPAAIDARAPSPASAPAEAIAPPAAMDTPAAADAPPSETPSAPVPPSVPAASEIAPTSASPSSSPPESRGDDAPPADSGLAASRAPDSGLGASPPAAPAATPLAAPSALPEVEAARAGSKRISIDFTDADVRTVIELIAAVGGYQVLFTPDVGGTITISLVDRPWEDALSTVLRARRLREVRHEDVMLVSPAGR